MDFESFENWVGDYESSFAASQLPSGVRDHLGSLLQAFLAGVRQHAPDFPEAMPSGTFAKALEHPLALDVPASARRFAAEAVAGFFEYLQTSGRLAEGDAWATQIRIIGRDIGGRIREDGTTRGVTRQRAAAAIGRNDPCPCGSGKKYKKCCGG